MGTADDQDRESKGARVALMAPETETSSPRETRETPTIHPRTAESEPARELRRGRASRRSWHLVVPWIAATCFVILAGMLLLMFAEAQRLGTTAAQRPTPTATPSPTATVAPTPTIPPIDGFQYYADRINGFQIQYPVGWVVSSDSTGPQFTDNDSSLGYLVQVGVPSSLAGVGNGANANDAAAWIDFWFNGLSGKLDSSLALSRLPGPQQPVTIGGVEWQSGVAIIADPNNTVRIRVQVYATIYHDKPYLIALSTSDDRFTAGTIQFFGPMIESFQFLPPTQ